MKTIGSILLLSLFLSSCSMFLTKRSFVDEMEKDTDGFFVPQQDFPLVSGDKGRSFRNHDEILERTPYTKKEKRSYEKLLVLREQLEDLENALTDQEYRHYMQNRDYLPTISEKIYFLRLADIEDRDEYLLGKGAYSYQKNYNFEENLAIRNKEIYVGMPKQAVIESWGRPLRVDIAGNPEKENERWLFYERGKTKYVFFEDGKVEGWVLK